MSCQVCVHLRKADAESYVSQGMALAQAARAIGVDRRALGRHMKQHASPEAAVEAAGKPIEGPALPVFDAIGLQLAAMLRGKPSATQRLALLQETRRLAESRARVMGPPPSETVRIEDVDGLADFLRDLVLALDAHPQVKPVFLEVLDRHRINLAVA